MEPKPYIYGFFLTCCSPIKPLPIFNECALYLLDIITSTNKFAFLSRVLILTSTVYDKNCSIQNDTNKKKKRIPLSQCGVATGRSALIIGTFSEHCLRFAKKVELSALYDITTIYLGNGV